MSKVYEVHATFTEVHVAYISAASAEEAYAIAQYEWDWLEPDFEEAEYEVIDDDHSDES